MVWKPVSFSVKVLLTSPPVFAVLSPNHNSVLHRVSLGTTSQWSPLCHPYRSAVVLPPWTERAYGSDESSCSHGGSLLNHISVFKWNQILNGIQLFSGISIKPCLHHYKTGFIIFSHSFCIHTSKPSNF